MKDLVSVPVAKFMPISVRTKNMSTDGMLTERPNNYEVEQSRRTTRGTIRPHHENERVRHIILLTSAKLMLACGTSRRKEQT